MSSDRCNAPGAGFIIHIRAARATKLSQCAGQLYIIKEKGKDTKYVAKLFGHVMIALT